jgi:Mce-associated membrane protein
VRPSAEQYKAVVKAQVVAISVVRSTPDRVVLLLFVNQTTTSTRLDGPKVDLNRVRVTMSKAGDRWLISGLDAL